MLSIEKSFLFIHIPKTGGNSIQNVLREYSEDAILCKEAYQDGVERFEVGNIKYGTSKHSTLNEYKNTFDNDLYNKLFKFSVIRNPYDRMISYYFSPHRNITAWNRNDFISLVNSVETTRDYVLEQNLTFFEKITKTIKNCVKRNNILLRDIDYMIRFENIDEDFNNVCNLLDIRPVKLAKRNVSYRKHYSFYYDNDLIELVKNKFIDDIEFYNYEFKKY